MASAPKYFDRVQESSTTTGTGTYTLAGAVTGHQSFAVVGNGNSCYYSAFEVNSAGNPSGGWEVGIGTYTSAGTLLSRDTILASSNAGAAVNWAAGTRRIFLTQAAVAGSKVVQVVNTTNVTKATGTTTIPIDDTIPQITEGDVYMTATITPTNTLNKLRIDVVIFLAASSASQWLIAALFQDATASALAAGFEFSNATAGAAIMVTFTHYMSAGTTSATTFRVRAGGQAGTMTVNGSGGARLLGGVLTSSITITEIIP
jgi:hypothetical protein